MKLFLVDMSFRKDANIFILASTKFKCQFLLPWISDVTNIGIYYAVTIEYSEEESSMDHFVLQNPIKTINEGPYPPFPMEFQKPLKMQWHLSCIRVGDWAGVLRLFRINIFVSWFHRYTGALICLSIFHKDSRELSFICITGVSIHNSIFLKTIILDSKPWSLDWQVWSWSDQASWAIVLVLGSWSDSPTWPCVLVSMIGHIQPTC